MIELQKTWELLARNDTLRYFARGTHTLAGVVTGVSKLNTLIESNPGYNWYVTLNPTKRWCPPKARTRDVLEWRWTLIDVDPISPNADPERALDYILDTNGLRPYCAILDSGRGRQAWVSLRPLPASPAVEPAVSAWLRHLDPFVFDCRIDVSCRDLARVARLPGTRNLKSGRLASLLQMPSDQLDPSVILAFGREEAHEPIQKVSPHDRLVDILPRLSGTAARFLTEGHLSPGRHSTAYATARSLCEIGVLVEQATLYMLAAGALCRPVLPIRDALRILKNAYEKGTQ